MEETPGGKQDFLDLFWRSSLQDSIEEKKRKNEDLAGLQLQHPNLDGAGIEIDVEASSTTTSETSALLKVAEGALPTITLDEIRQEFPHRFYDDPRTGFLDYCQPPSAKNPHASVTLREIEVQYSIYDKGSNVPIDQLDETQAYLKCYAGGLYRVQKNVYLVKDLDITNHSVVVERVKERLLYYTAPRDRTDIHINNAVSVKNALPGQSANSADRELKTHYVRLFNKLHTLYRGPITTMLHISGYHKHNKASGEIEDTIDLKMAPLKRYWTACWMDFGALGIQHFKGLHALEHCINLIAPVYGISDKLHSQHYRSEKIHSDKQGGKEEHIGKLLFYPYSRTLAEMLPALVERAAEQVATCKCANGCPQCVFDSSCLAHRVCKEDCLALIHALGYTPPEPKI